MNVMIQRGVEHYEKKSAKHQRKALAKIHQGDVKDFQKHEMKAQRAHEKAHAIRATTPPLGGPVAQPGMAPQMGGHAPTLVRQNLQGCNFGGIGGGLAGKPMNIQPPVQVTPQAHHVQGHPGHQVHQLPLQPQVHHSQLGGHKIKSGTGVVGVKPGAQIAPGMKAQHGDGLARVESQPRMILPQQIHSGGAPHQHSSGAHHSNHGAQIFPQHQGSAQNQVRFSPTPMQSVPPPIGPHNQPIIKKQPMQIDSYSMIGGSGGLSGGLNAMNTGGVSGAGQKAQREQKVKIARPQPPPPAPSTVSGSPQEIAPTTTLQYNDHSAQNHRKHAQTLAQQEGQIQLVKKW